MEDAIENTPVRLKILFGQKQGSFPKRSKEAEMGLAQSAAYVTFFYS